jgi:hypothetical protein
VETDTYYADDHATHSDLHGCDVAGLGHEARERARGCSRTAAVRRSAVSVRVSRAVGRVLARPRRAVLGRDFSSGCLPTAALGFTAQGLVPDDRHRGRGRNDRRRPAARVRTSSCWRPIVPARSASASCVPASFSSRPILAAGRTGSPGHWPIWLPISRLDLAECWQSRGRECQTRKPSDANCCAVSSVWIP